jgi:tRNA (adenine22-N1)-methyltransferase
MLSKRLQAVASFIKPTDKVIDIGCDHGYLGIYLAKEKLCQKVLLTDNKETALKNAQVNIKKYQVNVATILSDGLTAIPYQNYNTITISGMGTSTILKILRPLNKENNINKLIVQSNNDLALLRKEINKLGYYLKDETTIKDKNIWYIICSFYKGRRNIDYSTILFGLKKSDKLLYYQSLFNEYINLLKLIPHRKIIERINLYYKLFVLKSLLKECR